MANSFLKQVWSIVKKAGEDFTTKKASKSNDHQFRKQAKSKI